ncbi:MAG: hypothetical protein ACYCYO_07330 [Bacilli bacterium]
MNAPPGTYTAPLLRHGCAELASAQYTFPAGRVTYLLEAARQQHEGLSRKIAAGVFSARPLAARKR